MNFKIQDDIIHKECINEVLNKNINDSYLVRFDREVTSANLLSSRERLGRKQRKDRMPKQRKRMTFNFAVTNNDTSNLMSKTMATKVYTMKNKLKKQMKDNVNKKFKKFKNNNNNKLKRAR